MGEINKQPLVSVLMTVYNREAYIVEAIESVLASTYQNFELIIVDDGSSDQSVAIAKQYAARDQRIQVHINEKNLGDYPNRNQAATYAKGTYIKYLDADDAFYPWCMELEVQLMEQYPEAMYGLDSIEQDMAKPFPIVLTPYEAYYRNFFGQSIFHKAPTSLIIRNEAFWAVQGFSGKRMVGDFELWLKLSKKFNVLLMPHGMVWCRTHEQQESALIRGSSLVVFWYSLIAMEQLSTNDCPLNPAQRQLLIARVKRSQARSILMSLFLERSFKTANEKMRLSGISLAQSFYYSFKKVE